MTLGAELGFETVAHALEGDAEVPFSSSRARAAGEAGDMEGAARVLGRPHALAGVVAHGKKLGRTLGFPTANLEGVEEMLPPDGVYAVLVDEVPAGGPPTAPARRAEHRHPTDGGRGAGPHGRGVRRRSRQDCSNLYGALRLTSSPASAAKSGFPTWDR